MPQLATRIVLSTVVLGSIVVCGCARQLDGGLVDAAANGNVREVVRLLDAGANIEVHANDDWTPLTVAAREGRADVVRLLLQCGARVNAEEGGGHTPLFWAERGKHAEVVALLKAADGVRK